MIMKSAIQPPPRIAPGALSVTLPITTKTCGTENGPKLFAIMKAKPPAEGAGAENCYVTGGNLLYSSTRYGVAICDAFTSVTC